MKFLFSFLFLVILLFNFNLLIYDRTHYHAFFTSHGTYEQYGKEDVDGALEEVLQYYVNGEPLSPTYFNQREVEHIQDVQKILFPLQLLLFILLPLFVASLFFFRISLHMLLRALFFVMIALVCLGILFYVFFPFFFLQMHHLLFQKGTWTFYESDWLIKLFPESFFVTTTVMLFKNSLLLTLLAFCFLKVVAVSKRNL